MEDIRRDCRIKDGSQGGKKAVTKGRLYLTQGTAFKKKQQTILKPKVGNNEENDLVWLNFSLKLGVPKPRIYLNVQEIF